MKVVSVAGGSVIFLVLLGTAGFAGAQDAAAANDKAFVAKVSQGGMYEVEASRLALHKAVAQDVHDLAASEVHDHALVGAELKQVASGKGITTLPALNAEFQEKLDHLLATPAAGSMRLT